MRKWMVEFLSESQSRVIKITRVNSIRMTKIYFNFLYDVIESTRFLMRPPVIIPPWMRQEKYKHFHKTRSTKQFGEALKFEY